MEIWQQIGIGAAGSFGGGLALAFLLWLINLLSKISGTSIYQRIKEGFTQTVYLEGNMNVYNPTSMMANLTGGSQSFYDTNFDKDKRSE